MKSPCPKLPFDAMPGLPPGDEDHEAKLMGALDNLPSNSVDALARCLLRAALILERSGEVTHLTRLAEDMLTTVRLQAYLPAGHAAGSNPHTNHVTPST
jgi:hypothetical protein